MVTSCRADPKTSRKIGLKVELIAIPLKFVSTKSL